MDVYDEVRGLIVLGTYPAGQPVTELELCERIGVSRTPVREALRRLESDGLVRAARRGVTVVELDAGATRWRGRGRRGSPTGRRRSAELFV